MATGTWYWKKVISQADTLLWLVLLEAIMVQTQHLLKNLSSESIRHWMEYKDCLTYMTVQYMTVMYRIGDNDEEVDADWNKSYQKVPTEKHYIFVWNSKNQQFDEWFVKAEN